MPQREELKRLQAHKALLLAISGANRRALMHEAEALRAKLVWVEVGADVVSKARPYLSFIAPVAGFLMVRGWRGQIGIVSKLSTAWTVGRQAMRLWKNFRERKKAQP